jgi:amidohydrolase
MQLHTDHWATIRRDIHAHPELAYQETRTSDLIAEALTKLPIPIHRGLGKTGVVGIVKAGTSNKTIGLRADMDALPMQEGNTFAHASKTAGRMHACGHDGHVAMLLAAAEQLARGRNFDGTAYLVFQPAEEGGAGARAMIEDGLFRQFPMDAIYGMHNWPGLPEGAFALSPGPVMASSNTFEIVIHGRGAHAAMPHLGVDTVVVAAQLVQALQTVVSRTLKPIDAAVVSITNIHAGEAINVLPERCVLKGTVRTFSTTVLDDIEQRMRALAEGICAANGARAEFAFHRHYPPTVNHERETQFARAVMQELSGDAPVLAQEPTMGAEDFAFMLQANPGAYCFIGNGDGAHRTGGHGGGPCTLHNPSYDFNDALIARGAAYWVRLVERALAR